MLLGSITITGQVENPILKGILRIEDWFSADGSLPYSLIEITELKIIYVSVFYTIRLARESEYMLSGVTNCQGANLFYSSNHPQTTSMLVYENNIAKKAT